MSTSTETVRARVSASLNRCHQGRTTMSPAARLRPVSARAHRDPKLGLWERRELGGLLGAGPSHRDGAPEPPSAQHRTGDQRCKRHQGQGKLPGGLQRNSNRHSCHRCLQRAISMAPPSGQCAPRHRDDHRSCRSPVSIEHSRCRRPSGFGGRVSSRAGSPTRSCPIDWFINICDPGSERIGNVARGHVTRTIQPSPAARWR